MATGEWLAQNGAVAIWHLNNSDNDNGTGENIMTPKNATAYVPGKFGSHGLGFISTASVQFADAGPSASFTLTNNFSISAWIRQAPTYQLGQQNIVSKWDNLGRTWRWYINGTNQLRFNGSATIDLNGNDESVSNVFIPDTWYHLVTTFASGNARMYRNGTYIGTASIPETTLSSNTSVKVALGVDSSQSGAANRLVGNIDEVAMFNRVLTPREISNYYSWSSGKMARIL